MNRLSNYMELELHWNYYAIIVLTYPQSSPLKQEAMLTSSFALHSISIALLYLLCSENYQQHGRGGVWGITSPPRMEY